jgi:hypothetical protein
LKGVFYRGLSIVKFKPDVKHLPDAGHSFGGKDVWILYLYLLEWVVKAWLLKGRGALLSHLTPLEQLQKPIKASS